MAGLINKKSCKHFLLEYKERARPCLKHTRVASSVYDELESAVRDACRRMIDRQPSIGKTIKGT